jgi:D-aminoacyl-tRNA deacylase
VLGIVVSAADRASEHVGEQLLRVGDWDGDALPAPGDVRRTEGAALRTVEELHLETESVADLFDDPDAVVFASRHSGDTGPLLTAHFTGNFGEAEYGGEPKTLSRACPNAASEAVSALARHAPEGYDVSLECTHHGPTDVGAPSLFVELGSGPDQWDDPEGARAVARAVLALRDVDPVGDRTLAAFGGGHYAPRPTRVVRETDWAVGHVAADWALAGLDPTADGDVLRQALDRSDATRALVEGDRPDLRAALRDLGYRVVSETWVHETTGVALGLVSRLEADLSSVDAGLRFGDPARDGADGYGVVSLPDDLLAAAAEVDRDATREAADATLVAYETTDGGTLVAGRGAVAEPDEREELVARLVAVLEREYDAVRREGGAVVVRETAFDPDAAHALGVPEGPAFGRLASGEAVEVGGETVRPEQVHRERTRRFPV